MGGSREYARDNTWARVRERLRVDAYCSNRNAEEDVFRGEHRHRDTVRYFARSSVKMGRHGESQRKVTSILGCYNFRICCTPDVCGILCGPIHDLLDAKYFFTCIITAFSITRSFFVFTANCDHPATCRGIDMSSIF